MIHLLVKQWQVRQQPTNEVNFPLLANQTKSGYSFLLITFSHSYITHDLLFKKIQTNQTHNGVFCLQKSTYF